MRTRSSETINALDIHIYSWIRDMERIEEMKQEITERIKKYHIMYTTREFECTTCPNYSLVEEARNHRDFFKDTVFSPIQQPVWHTYQTFLQIPHRCQTAGFQGIRYLQGLLQAEDQELLPASSGLHRRQSTLR